MIETRSGVGKKPIHLFGSLNNVMPSAQGNLHTTIEPSTSVLPSASFFASMVFLESSLDVLYNPYLVSSQESTQDISASFDFSYVCSGDAYFEQTFENVSFVVIIHNLGKYPDTTTFDQAGNEVSVNVQYDSLNQITLSWNGLLSGKVVCN